MIGGGIFTVLGISVSLVGVYTPVAIILGGLIAMLAAYSYIKLGVFYQDEGATYSFYKRTFPNRPFAASLIGWWVIFGYISTLALYAYTFASYAISGFDFAENEWVRKSVAGAIIFLFTVINVWSVQGMGKIEDFLVYTKLLILAVISFTLVNNSNTTLPTLVRDGEDLNVLLILVVASLTFVAYEGFQLVINAVSEMENPENNIPKAIYTAIFLAILIYSMIAFGAILAIPFEDIIKSKEYALAAGADSVLGHWGTKLVIVGALFATSSAISGTLFGASRQMAVIAKDGYFPAILAKRERRIPVYSIVAMSTLSFCLILVGNLEVILEFGSVTFLFVSLLMTYANFKIRNQTNSSSIVTIMALVFLAMSTLLIIYYIVTNHINQLFFISGLYILLTAASWSFSQSKKDEDRYQ